MNATSNLLGHLRVVELGQRVAAGACGSLLAQLGAQVILVEPPVPRTNDKWANRPVTAAGKSSIVIDRASASGRTELQSLIEDADVVLLSTDLCADERALWDGPRPRSQLVCDITAFGHSGPLAGKAMPEALVQAHSAVADTMGDRDGPPALIGAPLLDMESAVYAAAAIVAALRVRRRLGFGQRIEIALYDVAVNALLTFIPMHLIGRPSGRAGNRHPTLVPWNAYRARDGWVSVCGPTDDQWKRICQALAQPGLVDDVRFGNPTARMENVAEVDALIGSWAAPRTVAECVERLNEFGIPSGSIVRVEDLADEPNIAHRGMVQRVHDPVSGRAMRVPSSPLRLHGTPPRAATIPAPDAHRGELVPPVRRGPRAERVNGDVESGQRALEGVRVVEIGMNTVAPLACRQLGALGADVIKVEPPTGDTNRWNAPLHDAGESYVFALSNTDKRGVVLNLRDETDREALFCLLATADMVIENLKPGSLEKLGVGPTEVLRRFPAMIYCSVNGFGNDSVYPGRPALDTVIQGMSGVMSASLINGVPTKAGISVSDQLGGQFGLLALLAALDRKERTGQGAHFDIAMQDCSAWATQMLWTGGTEGAKGCLIMAARDGHVAIEGDMDAAVDALGGASGASLPDVLAQMPRDEAVAALAGAQGVRCAPVLSVAEVMNHPQLCARELIIERPAADGLRWKVLASPMRLLSTPAAVQSAMPRLGHPDADLARELGSQARPASSAFHPSTSPSANVQPKEYQ